MELRLANIFSDTTSGNNLWLPRGCPEATNTLTYFCHCLRSFNDNINKKKKLGNVTEHCLQAFAQILSEG